MLCIKLDAISFSYRIPQFLTSSPTYVVPPPTIVYGLIAAILGIGKNNVKENRKLIKYEIQDKIRDIKIFFSKLPEIHEFGLSRLNADRSAQRKSWTTVINYSYGFSFSMFLMIDFFDDKLEEKIKSMIVSSRSIFTPYIGSSENLIKEINLVDEEYIYRNSSWILRRIMSEEKTILENDKEFYVLSLPSRYDEHGNWIYEFFVLEKIK